MKWLTRFIPGFLPGFGALLNPWLLLILGALLVGSFFYGLHIGNERLESYKVAVAAVGQAQEERTAARVKADKKLKLEVDREWKSKLAVATARSTALATRLRADPGSSIVPAAPAGAASPARADFDRAELDRALREFTAATAGLVGEGDRAVTGLDAAKEWVKGR